MKKFFLILFLALGGLTSAFAQNKDPICCPPFVQNVTLSTSVIMEVYDVEDQFLGILLFDQGFNPSKRLAYGKVKFGETIDAAVNRVAFENGPFTLYDVKQFHAYDDFINGCFHTVSLAHLARVKLPFSTDGHFSYSIYTLDQIPWADLSKTHALILHDYVSYKNGDREKMIILPIIP